MDSGIHQTNFSGAPAEIREKIFRLEDAIKRSEANLGEDPFPLRHFFADGAYAREISAPKGMLIVTKIHKKEHFTFVLKGVCSVMTKEGVRRIVAPCMMVTPAGTKRAVYVHEDTVWVTVHVTKETDLEKIEAEVIAKDFAEIEGLTVKSLQEG